MRLRKRYFIVSKQQRYFLSWNPIHFKLSVELKRFPPTHLVTLKKKFAQLFSTNSGTLGMLQHTRNCVLFISTTIVFLQLYFS
jgi:hypothetical protein